MWTQVSPQGENDLSLHIYMGWCAGMESRMDKNILCLYTYIYIYTVN